MTKSVLGAAIARFLAIVFCVSTCVPRGVAAPAKPNIVFILADDLGWGDVGFNGGIVPTPNLDGLASKGVRLAQHYVAPVCTPTRVGLLTGRCPSRFGVFTAQAERALPFDLVTLPRALKGAGYVTAMMGKWHLGSLPEWGPSHFGFDYSYGALGGAVGPFNHFYKEGPYMRTWHRNGEFITEAGHSTDLIGAEAIKWIRTRRDAPFFLYLPFTVPHLPVKEPPLWLAEVSDSVIERLQERYAAQVRQLPKDALPVLPKSLARHYAACIMHLDHEVGRIVSALEETGQRKNTLIVFTSDNGAPTGVENAYSEFPSDDYSPGPIPGCNAPMRGLKRELYEGGIHVAALANWPGVLTPGVVDQPLQITDWMPTFCALAGYTPIKDLRPDGMNVWPILMRGSPPPSSRPLYTAYTTGRALRHGDWKLIVMNDRRRTVEKTELYNMALDPMETSDIASQRTEMVAQLKGELEVAAKADGDMRVPAEAGSKKNKL